MDLKGGCENLVICSSGKSKQEFMQKIGRARRLNKNGKANVFDFYFMDSFYLYRNSKERLKHAVEADIKTTVIFGDKSTDGKKLIKSNFRIPK